MSDVILLDCNKITFCKFKRYPNLESKSRKQEKCSSNFWIKSIL